MNGTTLPQQSPALILTLGVVAISLLLPQMIFGDKWQIVAVLLILLGIPHGATDHLIFLQLSRLPVGMKNLKQFYTVYLLLMALYSVVWWLSPTLAFGIFLTISVYHFGQSNWAGFAFPDRWSAVLTYFCWGAFVLFLPIFRHFEEASIIIERITGSEVPALPASWCNAGYLLLLLINLCLAVYWWGRGLLSLGAFQQEITHLLLFSVLFYTTPLLLGFGIYFVFWHSMGSIKDQITFFRSRSADYSWKHYLRQTLPLSLLAIGGLGLLYGLQLWLGLSANIGTLFIFISVVTLPHMLLMDQLYEDWQPVVG